MKTATTEKTTATPAAAATTATARLSDADWEKMELERIEPYVGDYKAAIKIAKRNVANRDAVDKLRARSNI